MSAEWTETEQLLDQARAGDGPSRGRLLERYRPYLALLARLQIGRRLQGKVDPADVVQEVFLRAHRDFATFRGDAEPELAGWLRQILAAALAGLVRHYLGTQRRDPRLEQELAAEVDRSSRVLGASLAAPDTTPSERAARREQAVLLADALERLPAHYREVLILHHLEGLTLAETARRLGRTDDSVQKLWARGLLKLRQALGELAE
jgi:RNA polymerase sigma-70 factor, ECF subfamily